ncbi:MAG TPA: zinc metalloprotease HtpX [Armatimonadota bacterium]
MYEQISANKWKSVFLILVFMLIITGLGYLFARVTGFPQILPLAVVLAVFSSVGSFYYSDSIVLSMSAARQVTEQEYPHLVNSVNGLAIAAGLPAPRVYVIDDSAPNAFATGRDPQHAAIAVTTGLIDKMNRAELEGVIAHEMSHIKDYDIRLMALVAVLAGTVVLISDWLMRSMWWGGMRRDDDDDRGGGGNAIVFVLAIAAALLAPLAASLIQLAVSRKREFLADAQGAMLTRYPEGLANALRKISADVEPLESANKATAHMYISNPLNDRGGWLNSLFSTHPPVEERIRRLEAM